MSARCHRASYVGPSSGWHHAPVFMDAACGCSPQSISVLRSMACKVAISACDCHARQVAISRVTAPRHA